MGAGSKFEHTVYQYPDALQLRQSLLQSHDVFLPLVSHVNSSSTAAYTSLLPDTSYSGDNSNAVGCSDWRVH